MASPQYITIDELIQSGDRRVVQQLASDDGVPADLATNPVILTSIKRASEEVQEACTIGNSYTVAELDTMQTDDRWSLKGLVADLAMGWLARRRGSGIPQSIQARIDIAKEKLESLRSGALVFPVTSARDAGNAGIAVISASDRAKSNLVSDEPFFPQRLDSEI